jgi:hypothetical protein
MNFESSDCSGSPFVGWGTPPEDSPVVRLVISGGFVYLADGPNRSVVVNSFGVPNGALGSTCTAIEPTPADDLTPLRFVADLGSRFKPPFSVRGSE